MNTTKENEIKMFAEKRSSIITKLLCIDDIKKREEFQAEIDAAVNTAGLQEIEAEFRLFVACLTHAKNAAKGKTSRGQIVPDTIKADIVEQVETAKAAGLKMSYKDIQDYAAISHNWYLSPSMVNRIVGSVRNRDTRSNEEKLQEIRSKYNMV